MAYFRHTNMYVESKINWRRKTNITTYMIR